MRGKRAILQFVGSLAVLMSTVACTKTFDLSPPRSAGVMAPERRGAAEGFKNDARLREATRILILTPQAMASGARPDSPDYDSGVAFIEAALLQQGKVPIVAARMRPHTGSLPASCSEKSCEAKGDDMEHLLQLGREARADLILQLATPLDSEPVLARYVDAKTGDVLLVGSFFARPGKAEVTRPPDPDEFKAACIRAGGVPGLPNKDSTSRMGTCTFGPTVGSTTAYALGGALGGVMAGTGVAVESNGLLAAGVGIAAVGVLVGVLCDNALTGEEEQRRLASEIPNLRVRTSIPASRERTVAEALVAPLQGGTP